MRLIFAGTPEFAAEALAALIKAGHDIPLVLTQPDRPSGRGLLLRPSPVKTLALANGIEVFQPVSLRETQTQDRLRAVKPDLMVVAAYGLLLPKAVLEIPSLACLNIHASLLPRWRGAAPIQRAIMAGDQETGISIMEMELGLDTGPTLCVEALPITYEDTAKTLHDRLAVLGARLMVETLAAWPCPKTPQTEMGVTYASKIDKSEAWIDWSRASHEIHRKIRGLNPAPGAMTRFKGEPIKLWEARPADGAGAPGEILAVTPAGIVVACGVGALNLETLQRAGGKRLPVSSFLSGYMLHAGDVFTSP